MLKKYTSSFHANMYLNAADKLNIKYKIIDKKRGICKLVFDKYREILLFQNAIGVNTTVSSRFSKFKDLSAQVLAKITNIGPKYIEFDLAKDNPKEVSIKIFSIIQKKDVVIKAPSLSLGKGIYIKPKSLKEIRQAIKELQQLYGTTKFLVEPHFKAEEEYRILIYKGKIIDVLLRTPASVVGNGQQRISELIEQKNKKRYHYGFKTIKCNAKFLRSQSLKMKSVPQNGQIVMLQPVCNLALGGEVERKPISLLNAEYKNIARELFKETKLRYIGLDLMVVDPSKKPTSKNAFINEFNSSPTPDVSYFADVMSGQDLYGLTKIIKSIADDKTLRV